jgi:hypothetical protein
LGALVDLAPVLARGQAPRDGLPFAEHADRVPGSWLCLSVSVPKLLQFREEDEKVKHKAGDFTGIYFMGKSSQHIFDFDSDISDDLFFESLFLRVVELENIICN